jgi:hypothetical protein
MGLDVSFFIPHDDQEIDDCDERDPVEVLHLRDHSSLTTYLFRCGDELVDDKYDDFYVLPGPLEELDDRLTREMERLGLSETLVPEHFERAVDLIAAQRDPDENWADVLPSYVRAVRELVFHAQEHGSLICAWSA